jgi:hypothetical protein
VSLVLACLMFTLSLHAQNIGTVVAPDWTPVYNAKGEVVGWVPMPPMPTNHFAVRPEVQKAVLITPVSGGGNPPSPPPGGNPDLFDCPVGPVAVIILMVIYLGICAIIIYYIVKMCKALWPPAPPPPPPPPAPPPATNSVPTNAVPFPAAFTITLPTNEVPQLVDLTCTNCTGSFMLNYHIDGTNVSLAGDCFWFDYEGVNQATVLSQLQTNAGLTVGGNSGYEEFVTNGVQVSADQFPYSVGYMNGVLVVSDGGPSNTVIVDRSTDMQTWQAVVTNSWPTSFSNVMTMDALAPQSGAFYRARLLPQH